MFSIAWFSYALKPGSRTGRSRPPICSIERLEDRLLLNAGELDVVFNNTGMAASSLGAGDDQVHAMVVQPDSKIVTVGQSGSGGAEFTVARYDKDGLLDSGFGSGGVVMTGLGPSNDGVAEAVALQPDGKIVVAGYGGTPGSQTLALARYNPDGSLDTSFGAGTVVTTFEASAMARAVAVAPDGTIIVAGSVQPSAASTTSGFMVARYNADGSLDTAFGSGGLVDTPLGDFDAAANALVVEPDGTIVAAGHTSTSSGDFNFALVRYNSDGSLDSAFGNQGIALTHFGQFDDARALALQPDGKLVAAGVTNNGTSTILALARYNNDGSLDAGFGTNCQVTTDLGGLNQAIQSIAIEPDGKLVVAGSYAPQGPSQFFLARYSADGSLDTSFGSTGTVLTTIDPQTNNGAAGVGFLPDGTLVAAGTAGSEFAVARYWGDKGPPEYARGSANAIYINQVFEDLLNRPVDQPGLNYFLQSFAGGATRAQVVQAVEQSPEYQTDLLNSLYQTYLHRAPDPTGLNAFLTELQSGTTIEQVKATILGSPEYYQDAGATNTGFLQALYPAVLNRAPDAAGEQAWLTNMQNGMTTTQVAQGVLTSTEADQDFVTADYRQYLSVSPDPAGLAAWVAQLQTGTTDQTVTGGIAGSTQSFQNL